MRPVKAVTGAECPPGRTRSRVQGEASCHDHLRADVCFGPPGKARRIREPLRREHRMTDVDAVVDNRDLHAGAARAARRLERVGSDHGTAAVDKRSVAQIGIDLARASEPRERAEVGRRKLHSDGVHQHRVATRHACARNEHSQLRFCDGLLAGDRAEPAPSLGRACRDIGTARCCQRRPPQADQHRDGLERSGHAARPRGICGLEWKEGRAGRRRDEQRRDEREERQRDAHACNVPSGLADSFRRAGRSV